MNERRAQILAEKIKALDIVKTELPNAKDDALLDLQAQQVRLEHEIKQEKERLDHTGISGYSSLSYAQPITMEEMDANDAEYFLDAKRAEFITRMIQLADPDEVSDFASFRFSGYYIAVDTLSLSGDVEQEYNGESYSYEFDEDQTYYLATVYKLALVDSEWLTNCEMPLERHAIMAKIVCTIGFCGKADLMTFIASKIG